VAPAYNEARGIEQFVEEVIAALRRLALPCRYELVVVDDGSTDGSAELLDELVERHRGALRVVHLARNFGHSSAVTAALDHARGRAVILMDADHQDDPAAFGPMLSEWLAGHDVVYAQRTSRREAPWARAAFWLFYRGFAWVANMRAPLDAGNFALLDRRVLEVLQAMPERNRYLPGLRAWVGFAQTGVPVARRARYDGRGRMGIRGLWTLGMNAIFAFSYVPLFLFRAAGFVSLAAATIMILWALYHRLYTGQAVHAWASQFIATAFLGGINLVGIGLAGEYIARVYDEVKERPIHIVERVSPE